MRSLSLWLFALVTVLGSGVLGWQLVDADPRPFQPGALSYAHHQLALSCASCHDAAFSGDVAIEKRCQGCHLAAMKAIGDAHGPRKFADPRNAEELQNLDASRCVTCHREHVPESTRAMLVTQPADVCMACHRDIAELRVSHRNVAADSCTNAGCHNYHDNSTLYEAFLAAHAAEPALLQSFSPRRREPHRNPILQPDWQQLPFQQRHSRQINSQQPNSAKPHQTDPAPAVQTAIADWQQSAHAYGHANCSDCHREQSHREQRHEEPDREPDHWRVAVEVCADCHADQWQALQLGHHGMQLAVGQLALAVKDAQLPMRAEASHTKLTCNSCHAPHRYDTVRAEAESCLGCHDDSHSKHWRQSKHATRWQQDPDAGVSCAGCHMPREKHPDTGVMWVQHNQSGNLRPNDKMLKTVCMRCHGMEYAMSALADRALIERNFSQPASGRHQSMEWLRQHGAAAGHRTQGRAR